MGAPRTISDYRKHFTYFTKWLEKYDSNMALMKITPALIREYVSWMSNEKVRAGDQRSVLGFLRALLIGMAAGFVYMFTRHKRMFSRIYRPFPVSEKIRSDKTSLSVRHAISQDLRSLEKTYSHFMTS